MGRLGGPPCFLPMSSIAIVGFSDLTLPYVKDSEADEIWTINGAYRVVPDSVPRIDRLFEIHKQDWFLRKESERFLEYWEWLKQPHDFPIYMQEVNPEVPASVKYPYKEITENIWGLSSGRPYYTSSFSFMMGLAILEKIPRVEIYGIEMSTDTEYAYQKPGGEFMIGVALGRGIEVVIHPQSELCASAIYAYDAVPHITRPRLKALLDLYHERMEKYHLETNGLAARYNGGDKEVLDSLLETSAMAHAYEGGYKVLLRLMDEADYYLGRQNLDGQLREYQNHTNYHQALVNASKAEWNALGAPEKWQEYLDNRANMYANMGATQVVKKLLDECDLRIVSPDLVLSIVEK